MDRFEHEGYVLEVTYNFNLGLYEGQCSELGIFISDVLPQYLETEFQNRVNKMLGKK